MSQQSAQLHVSFIVAGRPEGSQAGRQAGSRSSRARHNQLPGWLVGGRLTSFIHSLTTVLRASWLLLERVRACVRQPCVSARSLGHSSAGRTSRVDSAASERCWSFDGSHVFTPAIHQWHL